MDTSQIGDLFCTAHCYLGGPQTGKTQALVNRARHLLQAGANGVAVLCASPEGVADIKERLRIADEKTSTNTSEIYVGMARDIALGIMDEPMARELFGRQPRILDAFEEQFLLEDLRTSRIKGKRLHEVFDFLQCGWTRLADDDPNWLITLEEETLANLTHNLLKFSGGILRSELLNFAVRTLRHSCEVRSRFSYDCVLVDDITLIDKASQVLARMLTRESFLFSADQTLSVPVYDAYPYAEGVDEFLQVHPQTHVEYLSVSKQPAKLRQMCEHLQERFEALRDDEPALTHVSSLDTACLAYAEPHKTDTALCGVEDTILRDDASQESAVDQGSEPKAHFQESAVQVTMAASLSAEVRLIARVCDQASQFGQSVLVVGVNKLWRRMLCKALQSYGIAFEVSDQPSKISDFRDASVCERAYDETLERLSVNPHDGVAWRSLVGFGDYVARSAALQDVREVAQQQGMGIEEALDALVANQLDGIDHKDPLYSSLADVYEHLSRALKGVRDTDKEMSAQTFDDKPALTSPSILVCSPHEAAPLQADVVIFGGFVNGLIPSRAFLDGGVVGKKRQKECMSTLAKLYRCFSRARVRVLITGFTRCDLETAEKMELHIARIRLQKGVRMCDIKPSVFLPFLQVTK